MADKNIRLIDANALVADYRICGGCKDFKNCDGHVVMCDSARVRQAINDASIIEARPVKHGRWIEENSVSEGYLSDWYISSVDNTETPIWTDEHIEELCHDFWIIPKTRMDGDNHD